MLIIIEGQARVGKTSLSKMLVQQLSEVKVPAKMLKSYKRPDYMNYLVHDVLPLGLDSNVNILDRAHLSEIVYRIYDETMTDDHFAELLGFDKVLSYTNTIQIVLVCDSYQLAKRHLETERNLEGDIEVIGALFDQVIQESKLPTLYIDTTDSYDPEDFLESVIEFLMVNMENFNV
jgi:thymidylate kinase